MKLLLVRPKIHRLPSVLNVVNVEPLELEYLASVCNEEQVDYEIYDGSLEWKDFRKAYDFSGFDVIVMSGYINSIDQIKSYAAYIKNKSPKTGILIGGVVAELLPELFYSPDIDAIVHSGGLETFRSLIRSGFDKNLYRCLNGICFTDGDTWVRNPMADFQIEKLPLPDRRHLKTNQHRFFYLGYKSVALIKTSYSCPYRCNFCYCRNLNRGIYTAMSLDQMIREIKAVDNEHIWIVDDVFFIDRKHAEAFVDRIRKEQIRKKFIIYSRADFIVSNRDLLPELKEAGMDMVIVGLEASKDSSLESYAKYTNADMNRKCVEYLKENQMKCTGLFIVDPDYTKADFRHLRKWIKEVAPDLYTISIFTPLPGTDIYEAYKHKIITNSYQKYDFLHLIVPPEKMDKWTYYFEVYRLYLPLLGFAFKKLFRGKTCKQ